jgi:hypothetical protein
MMINIAQYYGEEQYLVLNSVWVMIIKSPNGDLFVDLCVLSFYHVPRWCFE